MRTWSLDGLRKHAKAKSEVTQRSSRKRKPKYIPPCEHRWLDMTGKCIACREQRTKGK